MPDFFEFKDPLPSVDEVLFADADRDDGTETTFIELKGSSATLFRDFKISQPATTVIVTAIDDSHTSNISNTVDKNLSSLAFYKEPTFQETGTNVLRFDWGTQASRAVVCVCSANAQSNDQLRVEARWAGSDLVFSSYSTVFDTGGSNVAKNTFNMPFGTQTLRYIECRFNTYVNVNTSPNLNFYEIFDKAEGFGNSDARVEIQNNITGTWFTTQTFANISGSSNTEIKEGISAVPNGDRARLVLTNNGKWNGSIGVLISRPQTT